MKKSIIFVTVCALTLFGVFAKQESKSLGTCPAGVAVYKYTMESPKVQLGSIGVSSKGMCGSVNSEYTAEILHGGKVLRFLNRKDLYQVGWVRLLKSHQPSQLAKYRSNLATPQQVSQ